MKNLLYKELFLSIHPAMYVFALFAVGMFIPGWPTLICFIYILVGFNLYFPLIKENNDIFYTITLPVRKDDVVKAKLLAINGYELISLIVAIPFSILHYFTVTQWATQAYATQVGIQANFALFGFVFLLYGLFNFIVFVMFFKTAYKILWPYLIALFVSIFYIAVIVVLSSIPQLGIASYINANLWIQFVILGVGILAYIALNFFCYRISKKRFNLVDVN